MRIRKYQRHLRREVCKGTTKFLTGKVDSAGILLIRTMRSIAQSGLFRHLRRVDNEWPLQESSAVRCAVFELE